MVPSLFGKQKPLKACLIIFPHTLIFESLDVFVLFIYLLMNKPNFPVKTRKSVFLNIMVDIKVFFAMTWVLNACNSRHVVFLHCVQHIYLPQLEPSDSSPPLKAYVQRKDGSCEVPLP